MVLPRPFGHLLTFPLPGFPTMAALKYSTSLDQKNQGNTAWLGSCTMGPANNPLIEQLRHERKYTYENIQQNTNSMFTYPKKYARIFENALLNMPFHFLGATGCGLKYFFVRKTNVHKIRRMCHMY